MANTRKEENSSAAPENDELSVLAGEAAAMLKALSNPNRLMILCVLAEGECSVGELQKRIALGQSALSQHLALLRAEDLVSTKRHSQSIIYSLADSKARKVIELLHSMYCH